MNHHNGRIGELLDRVMANQGFSFFLSMLSHNDSHIKTLALHKKDLLEAEGQYLLPALPFTGDYIGRKYRPVEQTKLLEFLVLKEADSGRSKSLMSMFGLEKDEYQEDLLDLIAYFAIRWARSSSDIVDLMTSSEFSFALMKERLGSIRESLQLDRLFGADEESLDALDAVAQEKVEKVASELETLLSSGLSFLKSLSEILPNLFLVVHMAALAWHKHILEVSDVSYDDYLALLNDLYRCKLIENQSAVMWCNNCGLDTPSYTEIHGRVAPDSLKKTRCVKCGRPLSFSCVYDLGELLSEVILSDDGFLFVYFAWLLETQEIPFSCNVYGAKYESDFLVGSTLVECKVLRKRTVEDSGALREETSKALNQILDHIEDLSEKGIQVTKAVLLWNLDVDTSDLTSRLSEKYSTLFQEYRLVIFGPSDMDTLVSELKSSRLKGWC